MVGICKRRDGDNSSSPTLPGLVKKDSTYCEPKTKNTRIRLQILNWEVLLILGDDAALFLKLWNKLLKNKRIDLVFATSNIAEK